MERVTYFLLSMERKKPIFLVLIQVLQCGHGEVGRGVDPVGGLRPVRPPHGRDARVAVQVDVQHELPDEVEVLQVVLAGFVVGARVGLQRKWRWNSIGCKRTPK